MLDLFRLPTRPGGGNSTLEVVVGEAGPGPDAVDSASPLSAEEVRELLARRRAAYERLPREELGRQLATNRSQLGAMPAAHLQGITTFLTGVLPAKDYALSKLTNDAGEVEYELRLSATNGEPARFLFSAEDWEEGGVGEIFEDPMLTPFLRFLLPMVEADLPSAPATNKPGVPKPKPE